MERYIFQIGRNFPPHNNPVNPDAEARSCAWVRGRAPVTGNVFSHQTQGTASGDTVSGGKRDE